MPIGGSKDVQESNTEPSAQPSVYFLLKITHL